MRVLIMVLILLSASCARPTTELQKPAISASDKWAGIRFLQEEDVQLAKPSVLIDSILFKESATVSVNYLQLDAEIRYSIDEGDYQKYDSRITVKENSVLKIKAVKEGYQSSPARKVQLIKVSDKLDCAKISVTPAPSENYPGMGAASLIDLQKGSYNFREGKKWLGFQAKQVDIELELASTTEIKQVHVSFLTDQSAWIFGPTKFKVYIDDEYVVTNKLSEALSAETAAFTLHPIKLLTPVKGTKLRIEIENLEQIPAWHQGSGTAPWLFIDEIIIE